MVFASQMIPKRYGFFDSLRSLRMTCKTRKALRFFLSLRGAKRRGNPHLHYPGTILQPGTDEQCSPLRYACRAGACSRRYPVRFCYPVTGGSRASPTERPCRGGHWPSVTQVRFCHPPKSANCQLSICHCQFAIVHCQLFKTPSPQAMLQSGISPVNASCSAAALSAAACHTPWSS